VPFSRAKCSGLQLAPYAFQSLVSMASVIQPTTIIFERLKEILDGSDPSDKTLIDAVMRGCVHNNDIGSVKKLLKFLRNTSTHLRKASQRLHFLSPHLHWLFRTNRNSRVGS
jgi:hypothetical protein